MAAWPWTVCRTSSLTKSCEAVPSGRGEKEAASQHECSVGLLRLRCYGVHLVDEECHLTHLGYMHASICDRAAIMLEVAKSPLNVTELGNDCIGCSSIRFQFYYNVSVGFQ